MVSASSKAAPRRTWLERNMTNLRCPGVDSYDGVWWMSCDFCRCLGSPNSSAPGFFFKGAGKLKQPTKRDWMLRARWCRPVDCIQTGSFVSSPLFPTRALRRSGFLFLPFDRGNDATTSEWEAHDGNTPAYHHLLGSLLSREWWSIESNPE